MRRLAAAVAALAVVGVSGYALTSSGSATTFDWNAAYQAAKPGDTINVPAATYGDVVIGYRADLANLSPGCTPQTQAQCVKFNVSGSAQVSKLEIHGSSVWVACNNQLNATGYIDTEADNAAQHPDHVWVDGCHTTSFGMFNVDTATFSNLDVGPATVSTGCATLQGNAFENKIGSAGGVVYSPRNLVLSSSTIHDQNGDDGRRASDCHDGGLFLAGAQGLQIVNNVFYGNVVYNIQIQSINGAPIQNVTFLANKMACPVHWLYQDANGNRVDGSNQPVSCDGQASIQFDGTFPGLTLKDNVVNGGLYGCYAGPCDYSQDTFTGNVENPSSVTPPGGGGGGTTTTSQTTTAGTTTTPTTTAVPPPSVKDLIDQGIALLKQTTVGYKNHPASWYANTTTNWYQGLQKLAQARAVAP